MNGARPLTELLHEAAGGDPVAFERVAEAVYAELQRVAASKLRDHYGPRAASVTLEPDALVNETLLKLMGHPRDYDNRRHFYAFATQVMVRVLLDDRRRREAAKRGGDQVRVTLAELAGDPEATTEALALADLLEKLHALDPRKAEVVQLRVFWGLEMAEIAETMQLSVTTVERDWRFARNWLQAELGDAGGARTPGR